MGGHGSVKGVKLLAEDSKVVIGDDQPKEQGRGRARGSRRETREGTVGEGEERQK